MQGKLQLISPALIVCLLLSIAAHLALLRSDYWQRLTTPAQIELQYGESAVELTLLPSIPAPPEEAQPEPPPPPPEPDIPIPAPVLEEPSELIQPETIETPPPEIEDEPEPAPKPVQEKPKPESPEQDADLKTKGVETSALISHSVQPEYPKMARRRGQEGTVTVSLTVTTDGRPTRIKIAKSSGYRLLDNAAIKAVQKSRFKPAIRKGRPVESEINQPFIFNLED